MSEASRLDLLVGAICLGIPAVLLANAAFRSPRKLNREEWLTLLTVPMTVFQLCILGRMNWEHAGPWFAVSLWMRLAYCATLLVVSLRVSFSPIASWSQGVARLFTILYCGLLSAGFLFGLIFGAPYL